MAENKTKPTNTDVLEFINQLEDERKRQDSLAVLELMSEVTGEEATMWGSSIIGFGTYRYRYESGREGDTVVTGFSPRKQNLTLYITDGFDQYDALLGKLGKHTTGKSCLYIKRLADVDQQVLRELVQQSVAYVRQTHNLSAPSA